MDKFEGSIYQILSRSPVTAKVVAKLKTFHKTLRALMHLVLQKKTYITRISEEFIISWSDLL